MLSRSDPLPPAEGAGMSGVLEIAHELIESFLVLRFAEAGQVGVKGGHRRALVPEIDLDLAQVLSLLKQVRRVRMS